MRWSLTLSGTHNEGVGQDRVDAIVDEFVDRLHSNGYHLSERDVTLDLGPGEDAVNLSVSNPMVAREAAKLTHAPDAVVEPPREVLDKWVKQDAVEAGPLPLGYEPEPDNPNGYTPEFAPEAYGPPEPEDEAKPINVQFASDEAGELAILKGLTTRNFQGLEPSSANGFTIPDVKKAAKRAGK